MVEKIIDIKAKTSLQPLFGTKEIDSKCPKKYRPSIKKDKDNTYWKHCKKAFSKDNKKAKSHNPSFSANQP